VSAPADAFVVLAVIGRAHGIRGAMRVRVFSDSELLLETSVLHLRVGDETPRPVRAFGAHPGGKGSLVLQLEGVNSRDASEALNGAELGVWREALPELEEGEFYLTDLPGMEVVAASDGSILGTVSDVISYPTIDCALMRRSGTMLEIPLQEPWLLDVDRAAGRLSVGDLSDLEQPAKKG